LATAGEIKRRAEQEQGRVWFARNPRVGIDGFARFRQHADPRSGGRGEGETRG
jgi:hypothetical protein